MRPPGRTGATTPAAGRPRGLRRRGASQRPDAVCASTTSCGRSVAPERTTRWAPGCGGPWSTATSCASIGATSGRSCGRSGRRDVPWRSAWSRASGRCSSRASARPRPARGTCGRSSAASGLQELARRAPTTSRVSRAGGSRLRDRYAPRPLLGFGVDRLRHQRRHLVGAAVAGDADRRRARRGALLPQPRPARFRRARDRVQRRGAEPEPAGDLLAGREAGGRGVRPRVRARPPGMPMVLESVPLGNSVSRAIDDTPYHWRDSWVEWLIGTDTFSGLRALRDAGGIGVQFGVGSDARRRRARATRPRTASRTARSAAPCRPPPTTTAATSPSAWPRCAGRAASRSPSDSRSAGLAGPARRGDNAAVSGTRAHLGAHSATPAELKAQLEADRQGQPYLVFHDGEGAQRIVVLAGGGSRHTVGRDADRRDLPRLGRPRSRACTPRSKP